MKKNTVKAFTLVEMLIVIVIIGILIASLMPRMQSAQGRARDVARKNDLAQIQTAIITSQQDRGAFPGMPNNEGQDSQGNGSYTTGDSGLIVDDIAKNLQTAGMSSVPADPNGSNVNFGLGATDATSYGHENANAYGKYLYLVAKRNGVDNAGFALMAKTEVEGGSNWITCASTNADTITGGYIKSTDDLAKLTLCKTVTHTGAGGCKSNSENCFYEDTAELRYLLLY